MWPAHLCYELLGQRNDITEIYGLPDAHSGPAFATLAGLVLYAASDPVDLRDLPMMSQDVYRPKNTGIINRLMAALKSSF